MTTLHERHVSERFDACAGRFRATVEADDYRLAALSRAIGPLRGAAILDLGCGKGRFARRLIEQGAEVIGVDGSAGMLAQAGGLDRVRASALRLPFVPRSFDAAFAVEVFEHLPPSSLVLAFRELGRVLRPGGRLLILDKNALALDARRPWLPKLAVKWIDERRGLWMYPSGGPVRERWFLPGEMAGAMRGQGFEDVGIEYVLAPDEARRAVFRRVPIARLMALWTGRAPGGPRR
jgi:SAM-dependent methyltransferase